MQVVLTKDVIFKNLDGVEVTIPSETMVKLDIEDSTASAYGYHFDITKDEYATVH